MKKIWINLLIMLSVLIISLPVFAQGYVQLPEGEPSVNWINLDKASELIREPGLKYIVSWDTKKTWELIGANKPDKKRDIEVWVLHENGKSVQILDNGWYFSSDQFISSTVKFQLLSANVYNLPSTTPVDEYSYLTDLILTPSGLLPIPKEIEDKDYCLFGAVGQLAYVETKETTGAITESYPEGKYKTPVALHIYNISSELVKKIDLTGKINAGRPAIINTSDGVMLSADGWTGFGARACPGSGNVYIITKDKVIGPRKYNYTEDYDADYDRRWGIVLANSDVEIICLKSYPFEGIVNDLNPNIKTTVKVNCTLARKSGDKEFSLLLGNKLCTLMHYSDDLKYAYLQLISSNVVGVAKFNMQTARIDSLNTVPIDTGGFWINYDFDIKTQRIYFTNQNEICYLDQNLKSQTALKTQFAPENLIVYNN